MDREPPASLPDEADVSRGALNGSTRAAPTSLMVPERPGLGAPGMGAGTDFSASESAMQLSMPTLQSVGFRPRRSFRKFPRRALLSIYDLALLLVAFWLAYSVHFVLLNEAAFGAPSVHDLDSTLIVVFAVAYVVSILAMMTARGFYRLHPSGAPLHRASIICTAVLFFFALFGLYEFLFPSADPTTVQNVRALAVFTSLSAIIVLIAGRTALATIVIFGYRLGIGRTPVIVVGSGRLGKLVMQHVAAATSLGYQVMGFISTDERMSEGFGRFQSLGAIGDLEDAIYEHRVKEVFIALPSTAREMLTDTIAACNRSGVYYRTIPDLHGLSLTRIDIVSIDGIPALSPRRVKAGGWQREAKRVIDVLGAGAILLIGSPFWLLLTLIIRLDSPGPAIYAQERIGLRGKPFTSYKFRSMQIDADQHKADLMAENKAGRGLFKLKNDPRCTRVGRWIRRMSLDEIPQFWNVLRGDMSLVGPRPPLPEEYERYEEWEKRRLYVLPGLTGLWQVRGRSDISFDEMVLMDLFYIGNWSLRLDLQILLKTISVVLFSRGAY